MKSPEEQLDRFIDALNAGQRPAARRRHDPELGGLLSTAEEVRRLKPYLTSAQPAPPPEMWGRWRALGGVLASVAVLAVVGIALALAIPAGAGRAALAWAGRVTPTPQPSPDWVAELQPASGQAVGGVVLLRPAGGAGLRADVTLYGTRQPAPFPLTVSLVGGSCATIGATPPSGTLRSTIMSTTRTHLVVEEQWLNGTLALVAQRGTNGPQVACADLPVAAARTRQPVAGSRPRIGTIRPAPGWHVDGQSEVWATPSGDGLLRVAVGGPEGEMERGNGGGNLLWFVYQGSCATQQQGAGRVLYKENPGLVEQGRQDFTLVLEREWMTAPLSIAAFAEGGGPLITCGDLPSLGTP